MVQGTTNLAAPDDEEPAPDAVGLTAQYYGNADLLGPTTAGTVLYNGGKIE